MISLSLFVYLISVCIRVSQLGKVSVLGATPALGKELAPAHGHEGEREDAPEERNKIFCTIERHVQSNSYQVVLYVNVYSVQKASPICHSPVEMAYPT